MKRQFFSSLTLLAFLGLGPLNTLQAQKVSIHCWDFNGTAAGGNFNSSPLNTDNRVAGMGNFSHNLTDAEDFGGSSDNACIGSASGSAFCPRGGSNNENNGNHFLIEMSTLGFENIELSFWARRTGSGFDSVLVQYSTDGGLNFSNLDTLDPSSNTSGNIESYDLSAISAANNNANFQLRWELYGATSAFGNNRYDNIKLEGDLLPVSSPKLAITEFMASSSHSASAINGDWFEVTNFGNSPIDLMGFSWDDSSRDSGKHYIDTSLVLAAGESVIFLSEDASNGPAWLATWQQTSNALYVLYKDQMNNIGFSGLSSGGDEINLYDADSNLVSRVTYTSSQASSGVSTEADTTGLILSLSSAGINGAYAALAGDIGSPGNLPAMMGIPTYNIADVTTNDANGVADSIGVECKLIGVIHSTNFRSSGLDFMMYDATGAIGVFNFSTISGYSFQTGDSIRIIGTIGQFRGRTQISPDSIVSLGNVSLRAPKLVTTLDESTENDYVQIDSVFLANPTQWPASGSANVDIVKGTDTLTMRLVSVTGIPGTPAPTGNFSVRGAGSQFSFAANLDDGYQILPSGISDILTSSTPPPPPAGIPTYNIADVTTNDANGVADSIGVECKLVGVVHSTNFRSSGLDFMMYDATGAIGVFNFSTISGYSFQTGDSIRIIGTIGQFRGRTQISPDSIVSFGAVSLRAPKVVTSLDESTENDYVRINNVTLADPSQWPASGSANVDIVRGSDTLTMRLVSVTGIPGSPAPSGAFDVIGAGSQFTFAANLDDGYQILPNSIADIVPNTSPNLPSLYISEIFPKSTLSSPIDGDWFEIRNNGNSPIDLQGMSWDDESREAGKHSITSSVVIPAGGSAVFLEATTGDVPTWENEWRLTSGAVIILNEDNQFNGFSGQGSSGDEVNFYDVDSTLISRASFASADYVAGFSIEFDPNGTLLGNAVVGTNGAYQSVNGDVGSPGDFNVSLDELMARSIALYPNPASERFFIESEQYQLKSVQIRQLDGSLLRVIESFQSPMEISTTGLAPGVYLLELQSRDARSSHKLIVR